MSNTWFEAQTRSSRARFDRALLVSLGLHAIVLSLQLGLTGFGLPGLSSLLAEHPGPMLSLSVQLAEAPPVAARLPLRKARGNKAPAAAVRKKEPPQERDIEVSEPREQSAVVVPPQPREKEPQQVATREPRESSAVVPPPAPLEQVPRESERALSQPNETSFVMPAPTPAQEEPQKKITALRERRETDPEAPPPAPGNEEPQPQDSVAAQDRAAREAPRPEAAQEQAKQRQAAPQEQASSHEESPRQEDANTLEPPIAERQAGEQQTGRQAEEYAQAPAQAPMGEQNLAAGQQDQAGGQEQALHFALPIPAPGLAEEDKRRSDEERKAQARAPELESRPVRERSATAKATTVDQPKKALAPVEEAEARPVKVPARSIPCDDAEARFVAARELERTGDLLASFLGFRQSAECGYGLAQRKLGDLYGTGNKAVYRDYETSLRWYRKARDQGVEIPNLARRLRTY